MTVPQILSLRSPSAPLEVAEGLGGARPLIRLAALAMERGAVSVIVESEASNDAWSEEHELLYSKMGDHIGTDLLRARFVTREIETADQIAAIREADVVGHVVVRPAPLRTVLEARIPPALRSSEHYLTCGPSAVGTQHEQRLVPFRQQDGLATVCAHATVWMATIALSERFPGCRPVGTRQIYDELKPFDWGQPQLPSKGLTTGQIRQVLHHFGFRVVTYNFEIERNARGEVPEGDHLVYRYIESGIPVILGIETEDSGHSILVVGHVFDRDAWWPWAHGGYFPTLASGQRWLPSAYWTTDYICHDDNLGPYLNLSRGSVRSRTIRATIAIPSCIDMMLLPEEAERKAFGVLSVLLRSTRTALKAPVSSWMSRLLDSADQEQVVLRTVLVPNRELRVHLQQRGYADEYLTTLLQCLGSRDWLWLVEVSSPNLYPLQQKFGEIVLDPSVPYEFAASWAGITAVQLPGFLLFRKPDWEFGELETSDVGPADLFSVSEHGPHGGTA